MTDPENIQELLSALSRLSDSRDFSVFTDWLREKQSDVLDVLLICDQADLPANRAKYSVITKILQRIDKARSDLSEMQNNLLGTPQHVAAAPGNET